MARILLFLKRYPIPVFALSGILLGLVFYFGPRTADWSQYIWFAVLILGGLPIIYRTMKGMLQGHFASDIVAMLAIITAILTSQAFAGAVVVLMQSGGEAIEAFGMRRASSSLTELLKRAPKIARRKKDHTLEEIDVSLVHKDDHLIVRAGDLVPVDGTIIEGTASIDESALTGEPLAGKKTVGARLLSGSVAVDGVVTMQADRVSEESQYAKIVKMVQKAQEEKAPIQRLADRYAVFFTPLTLLIAAIGFFLTRDFTTVLAVLVVATPCPLILATPLAILCGINRAAEEGIIVKGGAALEQIASTQIALFDKTGTITFGMPSIEKTLLLSEMPEEEVLYHIAAIEQFSSHPIAKSIVQKAHTQFPKLPLPEDFQEAPGQGVEGKINGKHFYVGSLDFVEQKGVQLGYDQKAILEPFIKENKPIVFLSDQDRYLGCLLLEDQIRPETPGLMRNLHSLGVKEIVMLTGDRASHAHAIAKEAGIQKVEAGLLPEQKVEKVKQYRADYPFVMMVGDGINDAPALATATVGVAMGAHGTAISAESADIVLLIDDLSKVADSIAIGKRMLHIAKESIFIGMGLSLCLMIVALFGVISPPLGAVLQEIIDVAVILNALRAR